jgi:hypothetical protein
MPSLRAKMLFAAIVTVFAIALASAAAAPAIRTYRLKVAALPDTFATWIVDTTADVPDGTVYKLALLVFAGAACPRTLYENAIIFP